MINIFSLLLSLLNNAYFISYIKSKTFDLPLTFKEEQFYLQKKCNGCGAIIQSEDEKKIGFVPKNALDRSQVLCKRCFRLKNYHQINQQDKQLNNPFLQFYSKFQENHHLINLLLVIRGIFYLVQSKIRKLFIG